MSFLLSLVIEYLGNPDSVNGSANCTCPKRPHGSYAWIENAVPQAPQDHEGKWYNGDTSYLFVTMNSPDISSK